MKLNDIKKLRELGVKRAVISGGVVVEVEFHDTTEASALAAIQQSLSKMDAEFEKLSPEERVERLLYGHSK